MTGSSFFFILVCKEKNCIKIILKIKSEEVWITAAIYVTHPR